MQTQQLTYRNNGAAGADARSQKQTPFLQLTEARARRRPVRISFSPRREVCLTKRAMLAALREAEFAEWMNSGGDYLDAMHQPVD